MRTRAAANRPGRDVLAEVVARRGDQLATESYLETRFVQLVRDAGLPPFDRQVELADDGGAIGRVDFALGCVVAELVGRRWHADRIDPDSYRYARLAAAGFQVLPFTFDHVERDRDHVIRAVARALSRPERSAGGLTAMPLGYGRMVGREQHRGFRA